MEDEKKIKELKKEIISIVKENQKLQSELKIKNETINSIVGQNFIELKSLQEKHENVINKLNECYETNINEINEKYKLFRISLHGKLKDGVNTQYHINNNRISLLTNYSNDILQKLEESQQYTKLLENKLNELEKQKENEIHELIEQKNIMTNKNVELDSLYKNICSREKFLEIQLKETSLAYENNIQIHNQHTKTITDLRLTSDELKNELCQTQNELSKKIDYLKNITSELEQLKNSYADCQNKYLLLLHDNTAKQNSIDDKTLEIININSKMNELEKKNILLESNRKEINIKMTDMVHQLDNLQTELLSNQKNVHQLKIERDVITDERNYYIKELEIHKMQLREMETNLMSKVKSIQDTNNKEKENYIADIESKINGIKTTYEQQIMSLKNEYLTKISEKEKQVDTLTMHIKSFTETQYLTLNEIEKLKLVNETLKFENENVDKKITEINNNHKQELDAIKIAHKQENEILLGSYNETIKKSQEINDALQIRLNQTIDALGLSKTAIYNLKETNQQLEKQIHFKESNNGNFQEKYDQLRNENLSLKEKIDRLIELNNSYNNKERHYEGQIKQLQSKYNQLITLTKKNINGTQ